MKLNNYIEFLNRIDKKHHKKFNDMMKKNNWND